MFKHVVVAPLIVGFAVAVAACGNSASKPTQPEPDPGKQCTQEAMVCPDGSSVGRTGPNCEFAPCPAATTPPDIQPPT